MTGQLPISLLLAFAWGQLSQAAVPADPTITAAAILPRQNNAAFIGYVSSAGTWYTESCNSGLTWYQDSKYAQCCPTTLASCYAPTACVDGKLIYPYSDKSTTSTIACTDNFSNKAFSICNTAFIFENFGDSNGRTDIVCGESSVNWSYYRSIPASATAKASSAATTSAPSSSVTFATNPTNPPNPSSSGSKSKAWIAGAVIGPIAGIALIGAAAFFLFRRNKNKKSAAAAGTTTAAATGTSAGGAPPGVASGGTETKPSGTPMAETGTFNPHDSYNPYAAQGQQQPTSPAPGYTAPYAQPQPAGGAYGSDTKQTYAHEATTTSHNQSYGGEQTHGGAAELGGGEGLLGGHHHQAGTAAPAAELGGNSSPVGGSHTAELPGGSAATK